MNLMHSNDWLNYMISLYVMNLDNLSTLNQIHVCSRSIDQSRRSTIKQKLNHYQNFRYCSKVSLNQPLPVLFLKCRRSQVHAISFLFVLNFCSLLFLSLFFSSSCYIIP